MAIGLRSFRAARTGCFIWSRSYGNSRAILRSPQRKIFSRSSSDLSLWTCFRARWDEQVSGAANETPYVVSYSDVRSLCHWPWRRVGELETPLDLSQPAAILPSCRFTSFIATSASRTVSYWSVPANGRAPNARIAARQSFPRCYPFSPPPRAAASLAPSGHAAAAGLVAAAHAAAAAVAAAASTTITEPA